MSTLIRNNWVRIMGRIQLYSVASVKHCTIFLETTIANIDHSKTFGRDEFWAKPESRMQIWGQSQSQGHEVPKIEGKAWEIMEGIIQLATTCLSRSLFRERINFAKNSHYAFV